MYNRAMYFEDKKTQRQTLVNFQHGKVMTAI